MPSTWLQTIRELLGDPKVPRERPMVQVTTFGVGVCPGCRRLRGVASRRCEQCGSVAPVSEDT